MLKSLSPENRMALDSVNIVAGLGLVLSPWLFGFIVETYAAWNAWVVGTAIALIAFVAFAAFHPAEEWANVVLGLWAAISPWVLGFAAVGSATVVHVVAGLVVAILAAINLWFGSDKPYSTA